MFFWNARSNMNSALHDTFTPPSSASRCLESELTLATAYRILADAQLRDKPLLNPREFGNHDNPRNMPSSLHPRPGMGTMVLPLAPTSALHYAKPRQGDDGPQNPPESRARSNAPLTCA